MLASSDDVQQQKKRLRFKPIANMQQSSGDISLPKNTKELKSNE